jgi:hypothetical protein
MRRWERISFKNKICFFIYTLPVEIIINLLYLTYCINFNII